MALKSATIFLTIFACALASDNENGPIITINSGKVRGMTLKSFEGREYHAFRGIPYGKSTAGLLRFKPPRPVDPWEGIFDGTKTGPVCPQISIGTKKVVGTEDCLVVNVYVPQIPKKDEDKSLLPVLVFIHGGAFTMGSGLHTFLGPDKIMDHPVILVAFNYRLGILGFLNTEDTTAPGNYGMLDQVLALKWVKQNIEHFGGDKDFITIFGESAGGASIVYHMLSPLSKGLFENAIAQSGSALNPWALQKTPLDWAQRLALNVRCPVEPSAVLVECLRNQAAEALVWGNQQLAEVGMFPSYAAPSIEGPGGEGFLTQDPKAIMKSRKIPNKVPFVAGLLPDEGYLFYETLISKFNTTEQKFFDEGFPELLALLLSIDPKLKEVISQVQKEYFANNTAMDKEELKETMIKLMTDCLFNSGISKTLDLFADADVPTLAYKYTHLGKYTLAALHGGTPGKYVSHGDELFVQFKFFYPKMDDNDAKMSRLINSLWTTIAAGKELMVSNSKEEFLWELYDSKDRSYLNLNLNPHMEQGKLCKKDDFWDEEIRKLITAKPKSKDEL